MNNTAQLFKLLDHKISVHKLIKEDILSFWFKAEFRDSRLPCLLICYKPHLLTSSLIKQLLKGTDALISLDHTHLLPMLDYGYDGDFFYTIHQVIHFQKKQLTLLKVDFH